MISLPFNKNRDSFLNSPFSAKILFLKAFPHFSPLKKIA